MIKKTQTIPNTMKIYSLSSLMLITIGLIISCSQPSKKEEEVKEETSESMTETVADNTLSEKEQAEGWMLLFDGVSNEGWRGYQKTYFPKAWTVVDGTLHIQGSGRGELGAEEGGDIIYENKVFGDFHFKLEWKVDSAANSGIFYRGQETDEYDYIWQTTPEMQVLDNANHPDAGKGKDGNRQSSSLYDLIAANPQNSKPFGEWNQVEVFAMGNKIRHIQNGDTVVAYEIGSTALDSLIANSKWPAINENWRDIAAEGLIGLQDHGDNVWYKNIKIKEL